MIERELERDPVARRDADQRRSTDAQALERVRDAARVMEFEPALMPRQQRLIERPEDAAVVAQRLQRLRHGLRPGAG